VTHWMEGDWPEVNEHGFARLCKMCSKALNSDWDYASCESCGNSKCVHGNEHHECNECMAESDRQFDARREQ
jgi:hypothetical protein